MVEKLTLQKLWKLVRSGCDDDLELFRRNKKTISGWIARGDGCAVYQNEDLGSPMVGHRQFISFGSKAAQLEIDNPPKRMPDIGGKINWAYWRAHTERNNPFFSILAISLLPKKSNSKSRNTPQKIED